MVIAAFYGIIFSGLMIYKNFRFHSPTTQGEINRFYRNIFSSTQNLFLLIIMSGLLVESLYWSFLPTISIHALVMLISTSLGPRNRFATTPIMMQLCFLILTGTFFKLNLMLNLFMYKLIITYIFPQLPFLSITLACFLLLTIHIKSMTSYPSKSPFSLLLASCIGLHISSWANISELVSARQNHNVNTSGKAYSQSTHSEAIHKTVSSSAKRLAQSVTNSGHTLESILNDYRKTVMGGGTISQDLNNNSSHTSIDDQVKTATLTKQLKQIDTAKSALSKLHMNFMDHESKVTIATLGALLASAIMDPHHRVAGVDKTTCQERLISALCEMFEDNEMICSSGQFNKLIESQQDVIKHIKLDNINMQVILDFVSNELSALIRLPEDQRPTAPEASKKLEAKTIEHFTVGTSLSSGTIRRVTRDIHKTFNSITIADYLL